MLQKIENCHYQLVSPILSVEAFKFIYDVNVFFFQVKSQESWDKSVEISWSLDGKEWENVKIGSCCSDTTKTVCHLGYLSHYTEDYQTTLVKEKDMMEMCNRMRLQKLGRWRRCINPFILLGDVRLDPDLDIRLYYQDTVIKQISENNFKIFQHFIAFMGTQNGFSKGIDLMIHDLNKGSVNISLPAAPVKNFSAKIETDILPIFSPQAPLYQIPTLFCKDPAFPFTHCDVGKFLKLCSLFLQNPSECEMEPLQKEYFQTKIFSPNKKIPHLFFTTFAKPFIHQDFQSIIERNMEQCGDSFVFIYLDDSQAERFIEENFSVSTLQAFHKVIPGSFKADILRYCLLSHLGGVYCDINKQLEVSIPTLLSEDSLEIILVKDKVPGLLYQAFLASKRNHPFITQCLEQTLENIENKRFLEPDPSNIHSDLMISGPGMAGEVFKTMYKESGPEYSKIYQSTPDEYFVIDSSTNQIILKTEILDKNVQGFLFDTEYYSQL